MKHCSFSSSANHFFFMVLAVLSLLLVACGDDSGSSNTGGTGGAGGTLEAACGRCDFSSTPIGPNESEETCAAFGALFDCETAELQGECPGRLCVVTNCSIKVDCQAELP